MHDVFLFSPISGFFHHHNHTCSDSSDFIEEPNSHLFSQEVVLPPTSSSCSYKPLNLVGEKHHGTLEKRPDRETWNLCPDVIINCMHRERPEARNFISLCVCFSTMWTLENTRQTVANWIKIKYSPKGLTFPKAVRGFNSGRVWETKIVTGILSKDSM